MTPAGRAQLSLAAPSEEPQPLTASGERHTTRRASPRGGAIDSEAPEPGTSWRAGPAAAGAGAAAAVDLTRGVSHNAAQIRQSALDLALRVEDSAAQAMASMQETSRARAEARAAEAVALTASQSRDATEMVLSDVRRRHDLAKAERRKAEEALAAQFARAEASEMERHIAEAEATHWHREAEEERARADEERKAAAAQARNAAATSVAPVRAELSAERPPIGAEAQAQRLAMDLSADMKLLQGLVTQLTGMSARVDATLRVRTVREPAWECALCLTMYVPRPVTRTRSKAPTLWR